MVLVNKSGDDLAISQHTAHWIISNCYLMVLIAAKHFDVFDAIYLDSLHIESYMSCPLVATTGQHYDIARLWILGCYTVIQEASSIQSIVVVISLTFEHSIDERRAPWDAYRIDRIAEGCADQLGDLLAILVSLQSDILLAVGDDLAAICDTLALFSRCNNSRFMLAIARHFPEQEPAYWRGRYCSLPSHWQWMFLAIVMLLLFLLLLCVFFLRCGCCLC